LNSLDLIVYTLGIVLIMYFGYVIVRGMISFLAIVVHWLEDKKA